MLDCKPASTPVTKEEVDALIAGIYGRKLLFSREHTTYRQIIGKLMYAMVGSRPDLTYILSVLRHYAAAPNTFHLAMAKRTLAYIKRTLDYRLHYPGFSNSKPRLSGYVNSDWVNLPERKSTTGFCFFLTLIVCASSNTRHSSPPTSHSQSWVTRSQALLKHT